MSEDLISRILAAPEGSRELDVRIHTARYPSQSVLFDPGSVGRDRRDPKYGMLSDFPLDGWSDYEAVARAISAPRYTTSLDAALMLYKLKPRVVPSNPLEACIEALRQW
jgi:hypothetical protein